MADRETVADEEERAARISGAPEEAIRRRALTAPLPRRREAALRSSGA